MTLGKNIKKRLERLPSGVGIKYIIPVLEWSFRSCFYLRQLYDKISKLSIAKTEAKRISELILSGNIENAIIAYDLSCSPPTYGDFIDSQLMLARFFVKKNIHTHFYIVNSGYRHDWTELTKEEKDALVVDLQKIARIVLDSEMASVEVVSWGHLLRILSKEQLERVLLPFEDQIFKREPVYNTGLNVINQLMSTADTEFCDRFLVTFEEISMKEEFKKPETPYIAWHCRYSLKWDVKRNINDEEFLKIYPILKSLYPNHALMIISDRIGCEHFRQLVREYSLECLFSKDYSETFMGDGALILGSDYYFQLRGGGMYAFPIFSRIPYEMIAQAINQVLWKKYRITSWANGRQVFINATVGLPGRVRYLQ